MTHKNSLRDLLDRRALAEIGELAARRRRTLGSLISLTYDADPETRWRAIEALGSAAARVAQDDPAPARECIRRLFWLITEESGGICWHAPEAMAEIVHRAPHLFSEFAPVVMSLLNEMAEEDIQHFRPGVLWAIGRLGMLNAEHIDDVMPSIVAALGHADPQVRGMAVWCLGQVGKAHVLAGRPDLLTDEGTVAFYSDGQLQPTSVGHLAKDALRDEGDVGASA